MDSPTKDRGELVARHGWKKRLRRLQTSEESVYTKTADPRQRIRSFKSSQTFLRGRFRWPLRLFQPSMFWSGKYIIAPISARTKTGIINGHMSFFWEAEGVTCRSVYESTLTVCRLAEVACTRYLRVVAMCLPDHSESPARP